MSLVLLVLLVLVVIVVLDVFVMSLVAGVGPRLPVKILGHDGEQSGPRQ